MFKQRSKKLERIDTGNYTDGEYEIFLREIRFINRYLGDSRALRKTLLKDIEEKGLFEFSVLDVGAGSGELLRQIAESANQTGRNAVLVGLDLNEISAGAIKRESAAFPAISSCRGNALGLPLADNSVDYAISSLFFHHLSAEQIVAVLGEMSRVARRGIVVIDLHRHPMAFALYKLFCLAFRISPLVSEDGTLSIMRAFKPLELARFAELAGLNNQHVGRAAPFRITLTASGK